jgi:hypothetical protein
MRDGASADESPHVPIEARWCVARTAASKEGWAFTNLLLRGHVAYLPLCTVRRRDRLRRSLITVRTPLFRNYLFTLHVPGDSWRPIRSAPGVDLSSSSAVACSMLLRALWSTSRRPKDCASRLMFRNTCTVLAPLYAS